MANVLILDDNRSTAACLKLSLVRQGHRVRRSVDPGEAIHPTGSALPDLTLINQAFGENSGWAVFDQIKQTSNRLPALVYVLEPNWIANLNWIDAAVEAAISEITPHRPGKRMPRWVNGG